MTFKDITDKLGGRHTASVFFFSIVGTAFQYYHRLDSTYITFVTVMMGFVLGHSAKEDYFAQKNDGDRK